MRELKGICVPTVVALTNDDILNEQELQSYFYFLRDKKIAGLFLNGSTGEFTRLNTEEKLAINQVALDTVGDSLYLISGASAATVRESLALIERYAQQGIETVALCPPPYFKISQESVLAYFSEIAKASVLPILLYDIPTYTVGISRDTIVQLAQEEKIIGIKDSSRDFPRFCSLIATFKKVRPSFKIFTGTEELLLPSLFMGADGATIATAGILPEKVLELYTAFCEGNIEKARAIQFELTHYIERFFSIDFPLGFRAAVEARGFTLGKSRQSISVNQIKALNTLKDELALIN